MIVDSTFTSGDFGFYNNSQMDVNYTVSMAVCGDGNLEPGEECDDGNNLDGDGCSADCLLEPKVLDHFKCHKGRARFQQRVVTLEDQFTPAIVIVQRPERLCNPVDKNDEGISDETAHLTCYKTRNKRGTPPFEPRDVLVENQFGVQRLSLNDSQRICVPAEKNGVPSDLNIDHFRCYNVRSSDFKRRVVTLEDQFLSTPQEVQRPDTFCNPVDKNGEGINDPEAHLTCYKLRRVKGGHLRLDVTTEDQFGELDLRVKVGRAETLCVPSAKELIE